MFSVLFMTVLAASGVPDQPAASRPEPAGGSQLVQHRPGGKNQFDEPPQGLGVLGTPPGLGFGGGMPPFPQQGQPPQVFLPEPPVQQPAPAKKQTDEIPPLVIWVGIALVVLFIVWRMGNRTVRVYHRR